MKLRLLLMLFLVILLVPPTSATNCFSGPESIFARLKILIFGEFLFLSSAFLFLQPDLGLFLFDVGSDIYNGVTFIDEGNPVWGSVIISVMAVPMTVVYVGLAIYVYRDEDSSLCKKLLILLFAPLAIPIATVGYIGYLVYVFARRCFQPVKVFNFDFAGQLKLLEAVGEANLQAVLGLLTSLFTIMKILISFH